MELSQVITTVVPITGLIAAIIAGLVSWIGHRVSRQNAELTAQISRRNAELNASLEARVKLAQFRQDWIDELRDDMAKFHSIAMFSFIKQDNIMDLFEIQARIELRLNPIDENFNPLQSAMSALRGAKEVKDIKSASPPYLEICQKILKKEWDVLKDDLGRLDKLQ